MMIVFMEESLNNCMRERFMTIFLYNVAFLKITQSSPILVNSATKRLPLASAVAASTVSSLVHFQTHIKFRPETILKVYTSIWYLVSDSPRATSGRPRVNALAVSRTRSSPRVCTLVFQASVLLKLLV